MAEAVRLVLVEADEAVDLVILGEDLACHVGRNAVMGLSLYRRESRGIRSASHEFKWQQQPESICWVDSNV